MRVEVGGVKDRLLTNIFIRDEKGRTRFVFAGLGDEFSSE